MILTNGKRDSTTCLHLAKAMPDNALEECGNIIALKNQNSLLPFTQPYWRDTLKP
jgi:hypothetical protein